MAACAHARARMRLCMQSYISHENLNEARRAMMAGVESQLNPMPAGRAKKVSRPVDPLHNYDRDTMSLSWEESYALSIAVILTRVAARMRSRYRDFSIFSSPRNRTRNDAGKGKLREPQKAMFSIIKTLPWCLHFSRGCRSAIID